MPPFNMVVFFIIFRKFAANMTSKYIVYER